MLTRFKKRFLDLPISQKFVSIFAVMTLFSCALMVAALHIGLSVFEEKLYEKSLQELDFFVQRVDDDPQHCGGYLDPKPAGPADGGRPRARR